MLFMYRRQGSGFGAGLSCCAGFDGRDGARSALLPQRRLPSRRQSGTGRLAKGSTEGAMGESAGESPEPFATSLAAKTSLLFAKTASLPITTRRRHPPAPPAGATRRATRRRHPPAPPAGATRRRHPPPPPRLKPPSTGPRQPHRPAAPPGPAPPPPRTDRAPPRRALSATSPPRARPRARTA